MTANHSLYYMYIVAFLCKEEGKGQESINQVSHLTQDTPWKSDKNTMKTSHTPTFFLRVRFCLFVADFYV